MSLRINTNVAALNAYNNLSTNQNNLENSFAKLSSGRRINKAADDAAGLSIAKGLTAQINGLTQATSNANDGINVAQIADGALGTTQDILQRMRVLVNKAANIGTQDSDSWSAIQNEVQNLNTQLDNISDQTKFGQTNLLDGSYNYNFQVGADSGDVIKLDLSDANVSSTSMTIDGKTVNLNTQLHIAANGGEATEAAGFDLAAIGNTNTGVDLDETGDNGTAANTVYTTLQGSDFFDLANGTKLQIKDDGNGGWNVNVESGGKHNTIGNITQGGDGLYSVTDSHGKVLGKIDGVTYADGLEATDFVGDSAGTKVTDTDLVGALKEALGAPSTGNDFYIDDSGDVYDWDGTTGAVTGSTKMGSVAFDADTGIATIKDTGSNAVGTINTNEGASAAGVEYTTDDANADLDTLRDAIDSISNFRSQIGAVQNQLSYTVDNLSTAVTNVTASRSNLTDADLATQVTKMTQSQILMQASTSVLAQANQSPQAILQLLQ